MISYAVCYGNQICVICEPATCKTDVEEYWLHAYVMKKC